MVVCCFFFFKQKTAYEMRISDWSSDVCSSDLDLGACGYFRLVWPAESVGRVRPEWQVDIYRPQDVRIGMGPRGLAVRGLNLEGLDLAVFQRVGDRKSTRLNSSH